ncbi:hypothetical protein B0H14DRAFT_2583548 [Mycena olivaceomarginata]|nr:hypothetical protein B0H14DRAFT_2583548 [Mycena olivaceomarginata]
MNPTLFENIPIVHVIETYPQLINYDTQMYDYLCDQNHVCNFDLNLTYPQTSGEAPVHAHQEGNPRPPAAAVSVYAHHARSDGEDFLQEPHERWLAFLEEEQRRSPEERELQRREWTRDTFSAAEAVIVDANSTSALSSKSSTKSVNSTTETSKLIAKATSTAAVNRFPGVPPLNKSLGGEINAFYGCDLLDAAVIYALNFIYPWNQLGLKFDFLDIPYTVNPHLGQPPPAPLDEPSQVLNVLLSPDNTTRAALRAPRNKIWRVTTTTYSWGNAPVGTDPSPPSTFFMDETQPKRTSASFGYSGNPLDVFR